MEGSVLDLSPVLPVVALEDAADAVPLALALAAGGLTALEVTLRTPGATDAIRAIASEVPQVTVGAGTVRTPEQAEEAVAAGAGFLVSPGSTGHLLAGLRASGVPFLPGAATASEVMVLLEHGITDLKFFPAEPAGGVAFLRALAGPFPQVRFCPTGGVTAESALAYLALPNVVCVGGSWMVPEDALAGRDWGRVTDLARKAPLRAG
ncbi:bifunctional 4-hydroxy-2-oxoglutarate aldolase/2-dehydro-3-deoxy-phosphogluconate aldolase [Streptomyces sp. ACA25]|uniref:bifunctional 4-hydroxy-2-oxoglutarate aldolase/2-dehydro-3-deoxy-phosphogluconate aldolase n=1 Tax=Streptomyces sp. ACA25 TaxID=3022596 RepID=UPI002308231D|nr:bifunctional 4-hydroxy-2-oxoglutarate aldolase/2-dehydro-3-deoxy-phosphogluconate aldolase [Streptomyces sp. ACA25]MDB1087800.1 bifunctional 4-hydroxy-2-oxoglutarate aldolase/2-dehydro-3-deoxy-phosphogluconate aldolase [Streptomyces sp. ACA25]